MKKILLVIVAVFMIISLGGCFNNDDSVGATAFRQVTHGRIYYEESLRNHTFVEVDSYDGSRTFLCADLVSIIVYESGMLEIIDDDLDVYLICDSWQIEFYDYKEAQDE